MFTYTLIIICLYQLAIGAFFAILQLFKPIYWHNFSMYAISTNSLSTLLNCLIRLFLLNLNEKK